MADREKTGEITNKTPDDAPDGEKHAGSKDHAVDRLSRRVVVSTERKSSQK